MTFHQNLLHQCDKDEQRCHSRLSVCCCEYSIPFEVSARVMKLFLTHQSLPRLKFQCLVSGAGESQPCRCSVLTTQTGSAPPCSDEGLQKLHRVTRRKQKQREDVKEEAVSALIKEAGEGRGQGGGVQLEESLLLPGCTFTCTRTTHKHRESETRIK